MNNNINQATCNSCGATFSLKGWYSKADLLGTEYESLHYDYETDDALYERIEELAEQGVLKYKWKENDNCPLCNSHKCTVL